LDAVVSAVASSKKYRALCEDTIRRVAGGEMDRHGTVKAATKATKRRLHQVYGAFEGEIDYDAAFERLAASYRTGLEEEIRRACRGILGVHSSTRERLPILERFYGAIFQVTGQPGSLLDLGCGLHPLALPWMDLPAQARYIALDIDADRVRFLNRCLVLAGLEPLARCQDVLAQPPDDAVDVALLLKLGPTLERQEKGSTSRLLARLGARFVVVSFAVTSLSGREKGMTDHYRRQFLEMVQSQKGPLEELVLETELVYVVRREV
jgi:16S rRNA (guanine(1405)-N(7))-methyltransferase